MSDMKYDALTEQGIDIIERVAIPEHMVPADAYVEMAAKKAAGYFSPASKPQDLAAVGRLLEDY
jgi:GTP cyclohydrolase II